jgi:O-antigen/teichoic acid export membrane protein
MGFKAKLKNNVTFANALSSLILQIITIISGFIIPRLILKTFGSEVNGLISSFNQFFGYISLVEGGLTSVVMATLYKPLVEKDEKKISSILKTTKKFYNKLSIVFIIYTLIISFAYPIIFKSSFNYQYVASLGMVLGIGLFIQYNYSLALRILLNSDKKVYIVSWTQTCILIINMLMFYIIIKIFPNIHLLKGISGLLYFIQPVVYNYFINKYFNIDKHAEEDKKLLKDRWNGFAISLAAFIHNNTDVVVLSFFTNFKVVSVYSVYSLVTKGLRQLVTSISSGIVPTIGNVYAKNNIEELNEKFDAYEFFIFLMVFIFFTLGCVLINPFITLYTADIQDINYYNPIFGILLTISEGIYCLQEPYTNMSYIANKFKEIKIPVYVEAGINIVISILLVEKIGLIGVALGTLIAMMFRLCFQVYYLKKDIMKRPIKKFIKKMLLFSTSSLIFVGICLLIPIKNVSVLNWIIYAAIYTALCGVIFIIMSLLFYKKEISNILKRRNTKTNNKMYIN